MRIREVLLEDRIEKRDIKEIKKYIDNPPRREKSFILDSFSGKYSEEEKTITVFPGKNNVIVSFQYHLDLDDFTFALVNLIDGMKQYDFRSGQQRKDDIAWIEVIEK